MFNNKKLRKKLLVDKKFQISFIITILVILVIVIALLSLIIIFSTSQKITGSVYTRIVDLKNTNEIIIPVVIKISIVILLLTGGFALYHFLKYSHRIVGPLVRFKRCLIEIGNNNFTEKTTFREKDKLKDLSDVLADTTDKLNNTMKTLKKEFNVIASLINEKEITQISQKEVEILKDSVKNIESMLIKCKTN